MMARVQMTILDMLRILFILKYLSISFIISWLNFCLDAFILSTDSS